MILDSQSVKGAETVGQDTRGFDGGKLVNGRKRHLAVDMRGMALAVMVTPASPHDSIPARDQLFRLRLTHPELAVAWADSAYGGTLVDWSHSFLGITLKPVPRRKDQGGFAVLAKRWRVERAISWIMRARRGTRLRAAHLPQRGPHHLDLHHPHGPPSHPPSAHVTTPRRTGEGGRQAHAHTHPNAATDDPTGPRRLALTSDEPYRECRSGAVGPAGDLGLPGKGVNWMRLAASTSFRNSATISAYWLAVTLPTPSSAA
ncbi:transposase [Streptomyces umbrinus]|uniref:transposase n=1 Tax=Streptomyces umbrinus TaxID=67370 RepID=UPI003F4D7B23